MHSNRIRLGNTVFSIESTMPMPLGGNLPQFVTEEAHHITVSVRYALPGESLPDVNGYASVLRNGDHIDLALAQKGYGKPTVWQVLHAIPLAELLLERGTLSLHASYILHQGKGILFSGPSGIGKSTQASLWCRHRGAEEINGDRVLVTPGPEGCQVSSHYICGNSGICRNVTAELKAVVLLDQGTQNRILSGSALHSFRQLMGECAYDPMDRTQVSLLTALLETLMAWTPVVRYVCRKDESAVSDLERYLYEKFHTPDHGIR